MTKHLDFPVKYKALKVDQPMGTFYVAIIPAEILLEVSFSDTLRATLSDSGMGYDLTGGTQRVLQQKRMHPIANYINRFDAVFPNTIILAANFREEDSLIEDNDESRWDISQLDDGSYELTIPSAKKLAAIIDGQHRLFAFTQASVSRLDMNLVCSIFLDLPKPYQAQIFATINSTQKPVDRSLTYELFGYNINEEPEDFWSPDKLAVYLTRKLAIEDDSPLYRKIIIAPQKSEAVIAKVDYDENTPHSNWRVSTAVVVDGIIKLISSNPKTDTDIMRSKKGMSRGELREFRTDKSPIREAYLNNQDKVIYLLVSNYLKACDKVFWKNANSKSFITRAVGIQALFEILKEIASRSYESKDISESYFIDILEPAKVIDFSSDGFINSSAAGKSKIKNAIKSLMTNV